MLGNLAFSIHTLAASLPASITFMADTALEVETVTPDLDAWDLETALDHVSDDGSKYKGEPDLSRCACCCYEYESLHVVGSQQSCFT